MYNKLFVGVLIATVVSVVGVMAMQDSPGGGAKGDMAHVVTMYKSPSCGCCGQYAAYLGREGYAVVVDDTEELSEIKERYGVPYELESCHTMEIEGYVIEGHVPEEAIHRLLTERPDIRGIGMAGMPSGSPGMPGPKTSDFVVYEITHGGTKGAVFMTI